MGTGMRALHRVVASVHLHVPEIIIFLYKPKAIRSILSSKYPEGPVTLGALLLCPTESIRDAKTLAALDESTTVNAVVRVGALHNLY
jgi:hypothetical protein